MILDHWPVGDVTRGDPQSHVPDRDALERITAVMPDPGGRQEEAERIDSGVGADPDQEAVTERTHLGVTKHIEKNGNETSELHYSARRLIQYPRLRRGPFREP